MSDSVAPDNVENDDKPDSPVSTDPGTLVGLNFGTVLRHGTHTAAMQFESLPVTCYHYFSAEVCRTFAEALPPQLLALADQLDTLNRRTKSGIVTPSNPGKLVIPNGNHRR